MSQEKNWFFLNPLWLHCKVGLNKKYRYECEMLVKSGNTTEVIHLPLIFKWNSTLACRNSRFSWLNLALAYLKMEIIPEQWAGEIPSRFSKIQACTEGDECSSNNSSFCNTRGRNNSREKKRSLRNHSWRYELKSIFLIRIQSYCSTEAVLWSSITPPVDLLPHTYQLESCICFLHQMARATNTL